MEDKKKQEESDNKGIKSDSKSETKDNKSKKKGKGRRFRRGGSNKPANDPN